MDPTSDTLRETLLAVASAVHEPVVVVDANATLVVANAAFHEATATGEAEADHRCLWDLGGGRWDVPELRQLVASVLRTSAAEQIHFERTRTGFPARRVSASPVASPGGARLIVLAFDTTDVAVDHSQFLASAFQRDNDAVVFVDRTGAILDCNTMAERIYGRDRGRLIGANFGVLFPSHDDNEIRSLWRRLAAGESVGPFDSTTHVDEHGSAELSVTIQPVAEGDTFVGATVVAHNLSALIRLVRNLTTRAEHSARELERTREESKDLFVRAEEAKLAELEAANALLRSEAQLRQSQKMEMVGRLAGGVAHDFNNLLTVILSFSHFVMESLDEDGTAYQDMREIKAAAEKAAALTGQLLAFSRKRTIEPEIFDPSLKLTQSMRMLRRLVDEDVELIADFSQDVGRIRMDPSALEQIIVNLTVNAKDAMPNGGQLVLEASTITVDEGYGAAKGTFVPAGDYVVISVSDTGVGIEESTLNLIFEPFFTTKDVGKGTGLGLSTAYGIIKQAGGYIWVYSEVGKGTTFKLYFPRVEALEREEWAVLPSASACKGETILIVEDDAPIRLMCERVLSGLGYRVESAASALEALEVSAREGEIDLLLTDVVMPQMGGKKLAVRLSHDRPNTKVLFMSGYTPNAIVHHGVVDSGVSLLQKPFTPDVLERRVRQVLDVDDFYCSQLTSRKPTVLVVGGTGHVLTDADGILGSDYEVVASSTGPKALEHIKRSPPAAILCDGPTEGMAGSELYDAVKALNPHLAEQFLFISTDQGEHENAPAERCWLLHAPLTTQELLDALANVVAGKPPPRR